MEEDNHFAVKAVFYLSTAMESDESILAFVTATVTGKGPSCRQGGGINKDSHA